MIKVSDNMKAVLVVLQGAAAGTLAAIQNILGEEGFVTAPEGDEQQQSQDNQSSSRTFG